MPTPFPTATVTQGSGLTVNTLPNAGQRAMDSSLSVAIASDQSAFPVTPSLPSGASTAAKQPALGIAGTPSADVLSVQGIPSMTPLAVTLATVPLPTGAATAAKQPALGIAGTPSADVISIQGVTSMTPLVVSAASLPLPTGAATNAGSASIATDQGVITTSNTQIVAARPGRVAVTIRNITGTDKVSLGISGVGFAHGFVLLAIPGDSITIPTQAQVCATVPTTNQTVCWVETYN